MFSPAVSIPHHCSKVPSAAAPSNENNYLVGKHALSHRFHQPWKRTTASQRVRTHNSPAATHHFTRHNEIILKYIQRVRTDYLWGDNPILHCWLGQWKVLYWTLLWHGQYGTVQVDGVCGALRSVLWVATRVTCLEYDALSGCTV